ncbi:putative mitochondrial protein [Glycine soja]
MIVLTSIIIFLSFFKIPKKVWKTLVSIQRRLLWDVYEENKKVAWVSWKGMSQKKENGGLGDLQVFNKSLLGKWWWNIFHHEHGLWSEVLKAKYNGHPGILDNNEHPWESIWWKDVKKTCGGLSDNK